MRKQAMRKKWFIKQIQDKDYGYEFRQEGMKRILYYGVVCNKKTCMAEVLER